MKMMIPLLLAVALLVPGCKKDKNKDKKEDTTAAKPADPAPATTPTEVKPAVPTIPEISMTGTPSENMIAVFKAGVDAIQTAKPADAAMILTGILAKHNVADVRAKSKAAKDAGKGATDAQKKAFATLKESYKTRAEALGKEDAAAFGAAAKAWAEAWGIN